MNVHVRAATAGDARFVEDMLVEAATWSPHRVSPLRDEVLADPGNAHYVEGWPRPTDVGVVAVDDDDVLVGAAWYRFFDGDDPGYGFVDAAIPEVAIGVVAEHRGRGVGTVLLDRLGALARDNGVTALSLSVETVNPAYRLYARLGYHPVGREHGGAITMRLDLPRTPGRGPLG